jgi:hypothetical protein
MYNPSSSGEPSQDRPRFLPSPTRYHHESHWKHSMPMVSHTGSSPNQQSSPIKIFTKGYMGIICTKFLCCKRVPPSIIYQAILAKKPVGFFRTKYFRVSSNKRIPKANYFASNQYLRNDQMTTQEQELTANGKKMYSTGTFLVWNALWKTGTKQKKKANAIAAMMAGIMYLLLVDGFPMNGCWKIDSRRVLVESKLLAVR